MTALDNVNPEQFRDHMTTHDHGYSPIEVSSWDDHSAETMHKIAHRATFDAPDHTHGEA
jgi:hypothetical protein